jgi:phosphoribosylformylglycinamidine cyclo-ligase
MVKGMANITGGGLRNVCRMRSDVAYLIDEPLPVPPVFRMIQVYGSVDELEMYQTFNMGTGFVMVIDPSSLDDVMKLTAESGARMIGRVKEGSGVSIPGTGISFLGYP